MFHWSLDDYIPAGGLCVLVPWVGSLSLSHFCLPLGVIEGATGGEVWVLPGTLVSAKNLVPWLLISQICFAGHSRNVGGEKGNVTANASPPREKIAFNTLHNESLSKYSRLKEVGSGAPEQLRLSFRERLRNQWQLMGRSPRLYCSCNRILTRTIWHCLSLESGSPLRQRTHNVFKYKP